MTKRHAPVVMFRELEFAQYCVAFVNLLADGAGGLMSNLAIGGQQIAPEDQSDINLPGLLNRMQAEVDALVAMVGAMQTGLSPMIVDKAGSDPAAFRHAQNIDLVWQILGSLSLVLEELKGDEATQRPVDIDAIVRHVPLANLAARLRGKPSLVPVSDDLDLF